MRLRMIGIDHTTAPVEVRERYSFTRAGARDVMNRIRLTSEKSTGIRGCVLLSTCNRMELYVSLTPEAEPELYEMICGWKQIDPGPERALFYEKKDMEAARHVFELTCGLRSQILGEDQILTQVKDALMLAREETVTDNCMEVLFRQAITAAKEIKSSIAFDKGNRSAATAVIRMLQKEGMLFDGKQALVIGNGMMGKLTAQALMEAGAQVTVTVRQYHSGTVDIPEGAQRINYGERYEKLADACYIFSATASPNLTITPERLTGIGLEGKTFVDLAVPRDIDPAVGELPGVRLLCMDDLDVEQLSGEQEEQQTRAQGKIAEALTEFERFFFGRDMIPRIGKLAAEISEDLWGRMRKECTTLADEQRMHIEQAVRRSGDKVAAHMLYALRDGLDAESFAHCLQVLEGDYQSKR
ncbi:MAG: glutamyl-tRNA reductase [bacterium]|nr:glutamyl-tRNA reductase [bacterium]MDY4099259.1 glutamyl-tRNA reductase [Lachnospiraceae bacterium]